MRPQNKRFLKCFTKLIAPICCDTELFDNNYNDDGDELFLQKA